MMDFDVKLVRDSILQELIARNFFSESEIEHVHISSPRT